MIYQLKYRIQIMEKNVSLITLCYHDSVIMTDFLVITDYYNYYFDYQLFLHFCTL